jgi:predicted transcriptional regulator
MSQSDVVVMRRRSTVEMDIAVLQALSGPKLLKLTHIMYKANLNAQILKEKLVVLEAKGLIKSQKLHKNHIKYSGKDRMFYGATSKGLEVLRSYLSAYNALGSVE